VLLFVNGLNLLPVLPLDGGHVLQDTLFCRNRWLDGAFRVLAIFGMVGLGLLLGAKLLAYLAIPMAIALPVVFRLGKVTDAIRRQLLPPPLPGEDRIPTATAQAIISALRAAFPPKLVLSNKTLAQHTLTVFERLNAGPPGILATLAFLLVQGGAFFLAVVVAMLLVISQQGGGLKNFMSAAVRQPHHAYRPGDVQTWGGRSAEEQPKLHTLIVTTLPDREGARSAFAGLTNHLPPTATLTRLGDSLVLSMPAGDDAAREHWFDEMQACATNTFVALSNAPVTASLICIAPTGTEATNLTRELGAFFNAANQMRLIAPWSPEAKRTDFASYRRAREQWGAIGDEIGKAWKDPAVRSYSAKISAAIRRGAAGEATRLMNEQAAKSKELEAKAQERLRAASSPPMDPALLNLYARLHTPDLTNSAARKALLRELAGKLGEVTYADDRPAPGADACSVTGGIITQHGLLVEARWISFCDLACGLPAMADWLDSRGCRQIKYDLQDSGWIGSLYESDE
jgi:hypothetical protein